MECPVCYERTTNCKLVCGHQFCKTCVKTWYMKGAESTCPMCRKKVHYRRMPVKKWKEEAEEEKKQQIFEESFDSLVELIMEPIEISDDIKLYRTDVNMSELCDLQTTFRAIKDFAEPDELDFILNETGDYYSDRRTHINNRVYSENGHRYNITRKNIKTKPIRF